MAIVDARVCVYFARPSIAVAKIKDYSQSNHNENSGIVVGGDLQEAIQTKTSIINSTQERLILYTLYFSSRQPLLKKRKKIFTLIAFT